MSEPTYREGAAPRINLPVSGEPPEGDVFEMVDNPDAPDMSTGPDAVKGYLHDKNSDISTALRVQRDYDYRLKVQAEDAKASRALEIRADFPQGPAVDRYNFNGAADDGNLPAKGAPAEMFDPRYSIVADQRSADEVAGDVAMPGLLYDMGVRPTEIDVGGTKTTTPIEAWAGSYGLGQQMTGRSMVNTMLGVGNAAINTVRDLVGGRDVGPGEERPGDVIPTIGAVGELGKPETAERALTFMSQLVIGQLAMSRLTGLKVAGTLARETTAALLVEGIFNDPANEFGGNLAPMVMKFFDIGDQELRDSIDSTKQHSLLVGRVIQMLEAGGVIGAIAGAPLIKHFAEGVVDALGKHIGSLPPTTPISRQRGSIGVIPKPPRMPTPGRTVSARVVDPITPRDLARGAPERVGAGDIVSLRTGREAMAMNPKAFAKNMATFDKVVTSFKPPRANWSADKKFDHVVRGMADNLLWLYDKLPKRLRDRARMWYTGGNKITGDLAKEHGLAHEQTAASMATLSPQKDWFMNVDLNRRVIEGLAAGRKANFQATDAMREWAATYANSAHTLRLEEAARDLAKGLIDADKYSELVAYSRSKLLEDRDAFSVLSAGRNEPLDADPEAQARWIRAWDETTNDRGYNTLSPDGEVIGPALNKDGTPSKVAWGDFNSIQKAASVLDPKLKDDPEEMLRVISRALGREHKVRNFYNDIIDPLNPAFVTSDTHNVAAALFKPLSGQSIEVKQNFGGGGAASSKVGGSSGTYGVYHEAVNLAAKERGEIPSQMQSITWEAVRALFKPEQKNPGLTKFVNDTWRKVQRGTMTLKDGYNAIFKEAKGFGKIDWDLPDPGTKPESTYDWVSSDVEEGINMEYPDVAESLFEYTQNLKPSGITNALKSESYPAYKADMQLMLKKRYPDGMIDVALIPGYSGSSKASKFSSVSIHPEWGVSNPDTIRWKIPISDVHAFGNIEEGELIIRRKLPRKTK